MVVRAGKGAHRVCGTDASMATLCCMPPFCAAIALLSTTWWASSMKKLDKTCSFKLSTGYSCVGGRGTVVLVAVLCTWSAPHTHTYTSTRTHTLQDGLTALELAQRDPNLTDVVHCIQGAAAETSSILHTAAGRGDKATVRRLLDRGANVDWRDGHGSTALHKAAFAGNVGLCKLLLEQGADPRIVANVSEAHMHNAWCSIPAHTAYTHASRTDRRMARRHWKWRKRQEKWMSSTQLGYAVALVSLLPALPCCSPSHPCEAHTNTTITEHGHRKD